MIFDWMKNKIPHCAYVKKRMNDDILIVAGKDLMMYYLNPTAAFFFNCIDGKSTIEDIKHNFLQNYDVDEKTLEQDMINLIRDLQWKQIIALE